MCQERKELMIHLHRIKENKYKVNEDENPFEFVKLMLKYIGHLDPELRDDLIYSTLFHWIWENKYFNHQELKEMLLTLIDEQHMFFKIGNNCDDSVFTRSFSVLAVSLILCRHTDKPFLEKETFINVKDALIRYYNSERDLRGYVEEKGWVHSAAHGADALDELVQCRECDEVTHQEVLESIEKVLFNWNYIMCHKEDDRIANIVFMIYKINLVSNEKLIEWFEKLCGNCNFSEKQDKYISSVNFRNFIRSLYFKFKHYQCEEEILNVILNIERKLNSSIY